MSSNLNEEIKKISIGEKEFRKITNILKYYSIEPEHIEKLRCVYKIKYNNKNYCLKKIRKGNKKILKSLYLIEYLKKNGFINIASYISVREGLEYIKTKNSIYYMTEWIEGRECNLYDLEELKRASSLLADFHIKSKGFYSKEAKLENTIKNWSLELRKVKHDILRFKKSIESKRVKTIFDIEYSDGINTVLEFLDLSIEMIDKSNYNDLMKKAKIERCICHDSFYYKNIIVDDSLKMYLINFDSVVYDIHVYDLAKFIRRILYKRIYSWDFNVAKELISSYTQINKLSKEELKVLLSLIIFPQKFWKLGKKRYYKNKKWDEEKYIKKLTRILQYMDNQKEFIKRYTDFYEIDKKMDDNEN
ncbi:spore coat protein, CotS family [Caloramator quimbayensis]|uniref:Spore coat protein, CotS family n=1 Tax=Caloramator quimbayensis TaxID=1147123 RepID=A0A1T4XAU3_9CLOT|nr:CotS family spore coat protein [Caloramator quimbayensis]SKA86557.1 spore coat protein, CotS family [Caloramator quimbayensis]